MAKKKLPPKLEAVIKELRKVSKDDDIIVQLGDEVGKSHPCIPTGIYGVDWPVCKIGGFPCGRITEIYGPEAAGKTSLALRAIASAQRQGMWAAFIDAECTFDANWAALNGVDVDNLLVSRPEHGELALTEVLKLIESDEVGIIVVDSVAALVTQAELENDLSAFNVGSQARLMGKFCRVAVNSILKTDIVLVFINQLREKIGVTFGSNETTPGGRALKHYAALRLDVRRIGIIKNGEEVVGNTVKVTNRKGKTGAPNGVTEVELFFNSSFDAKGSLFDAAVTKGIFTKNGSWFKYGDKDLGQGKNKAKEAMPVDEVYSKLMSLHE